MDNRLTRINLEKKKHFYCGVFIEGEK